MKTYEEKQETVTRKILVERCCDLCGRKAKNDEWDAVGMDINETEVRVEVKQKEGYSCPDGGSGIEYSVDLCPQCFKEKLVPWLQSQGAKVAPVEWDW